MPGPLGIGSGGGGGGAGTVTSVSGSAPISVANGTTTPAISVTAAAPGAVTGGATASAGTIANGVAAADHVHSTSNLAVLNASSNNFSGGFVGIGAGIAPAQHLTINAASGANRLIQFSQSDTAKAYVGIGTDNVLRVQTQDGASVRLSTNASDRLNIDGSGNVGIGTTSPSSKLQVVGNAAVTGDLTVTQDASSALGPSIFMVNNSGGAGAGASIEMSGYGTANPATVQIRSEDDGSYSSHLRFLIKQSGVSSTAPAFERLTLLSSGNVGINNATPGSALDVKGTLRLSGATSGYVGFAPASAAGSTTYTLPSADGTTGQVLSTNGSGTLTWATASGGASKVLSFMTMGV